MKKILLEKLLPNSTEHMESATPITLRRRRPPSHGVRHAATTASDRQGSDANCWRRLLVAAPLFFYLTTLLWILSIFFSQKTLSLSHTHTRMNQGRGTALPNTLPWLPPWLHVFFQPSRPLFSIHLLNLNSLVQDTHVAKATTCPVLMPCTTRLDPLTN